MFRRANWGEIEKHLNRSHSDCGQYVDIIRVNEKYLSTIRKCTSMSLRVCLDKMYMFTFVYPMVAIVNEL